MAKNVIKELIIILLLCLAIILVLGILLYGYIPTSKTVPTEVSYSTPEEVKEELIASEGVDENEIIMTYEIDSTDLNNYKKVQDYQPGKSNPFSSYETQTTTGVAGNETTAGSGTTTNTTTSTNNNSSSGSTQTTNESTTNTSKGFYPDTGTK